MTPRELANLLRYNAPLSSEARVRIMDILEKADDLYVHAFNNGWIANSQRETTNPGSKRMDVPAKVKNHRSLEAPRPIIPRVSKGY